MRPPIYEPKGAAREYGDLALNIYTGCPHSCTYCFAPSVLHKEKTKFNQEVIPRPGIVEEVRKQLEKERITGKLIHLCFTCDPAPYGLDITPTVEIIKLLHEHGNHIQFLTKGDGREIIPLLDKDDWYGITISCLSPTAKEVEPNALSPEARLYNLMDAKRDGIHTWVSFEPVIDANDVLTVIKTYHNFIDKAKIGKLNYHQSSIDWKTFGFAAEKLCQSLGLEYYIKDSLRKEMEK